MKSILCALLLLCVAAAVLAETCLDKEDIAPCTCQTLSGSHRDIGIKCNGRSDRQVRELDFKAHFAQLQGKQMGYLWLYDIPFKRLPTDLFKGMHVRHLDFTDCELEALADKEDDLQFQGLEYSLEYLSIRSSFTGANVLKNFKLSHLKHLRQIYLFGNNVPEVPNEWFQDGHASLKDISFVRCEVKSVGDKAFAHLPNLENIAFNENSITVVSRSMVARPAPKLHTIVLVGNQISRLPDDAFDDMPALAQLDLSGNQLQRLPEATWSRVWDQLEILYLMENPIACDCHVDWMFGRKRPDFIAECISPKERDGKYLNDLIDEHEEKNES